MTAFADRFPAFADLGDAELLELIEETNTARALAARDRIAEADACFEAAAVRLGIETEIETLTEAVLNGEIGDQ
ncbi:hypothetical protein [Glycomyces xiaoerkulensis]|uniref:hypothetical protein n=1 Tax=Glycomyces xiaoerkulensis TaxID=2038139 RepID=UPI000C26AF6B|nr:hypothetical protein [Glycomyces xiaoerkulensis]